MIESDCFWNVLDKKRQKVMPNLRFLKEHWSFYLAGGTALALQIGHRTSIDFDFYTSREFDPKELFSEFKKAYPKIHSVHLAQGTLIVNMDGVIASCFLYQYPLIESLVKHDFVDLASLNDIAAMKMIAIMQRGTKRDFVDIYYLLKQMSLEEILKITQKKYDVFNPYAGLRALVYFEDADRDSSRANLRTFENIGFEKIKKELVSAVNRYKEMKINEQN